MYTSVCIHPRIDGNPPLKVWSALREVAPRHRQLLFGGTLQREMDGSNVTLYPRLSEVRKWFSPHWQLSLITPYSMRWMITRSFGTRVLWSWWYVTWQPENNNLNGGYSRSIYKSMLYWFRSLPASLSRFLPVGRSLGLLATLSLGLSVCFSVSLRLLNSWLFLLLIQTNRLQICQNGTFWICWFFKAVLNSIHLVIVSLVSIFPEISIRCVDSSFSLRRRMKLAYW
jgi:hypothetical protein